MRRFKKTRGGYVFDRLLFLAGLTPLMVLLVFHTIHIAGSEYTFYMECEGGTTVSEWGACRNPFWPDCPRVVERQAPVLCEDRYLPSGAYGSPPGWAFDWLFPAFVGGFILAFGSNHYLWNGGFRT